MRPLRLAFAASAILVAACSSAPGPSSPGPRSDSRTVTLQALQTATQTNLYDFIVANRPRWLQARGPTRIGAAGTGETRLAIAVFLENQNVGGPDQLRSYPVAGIHSLRYYDAAEAQARFNVRDVGAIIQIIPVR